MQYLKIGMTDEQIEAALDAQFNAIEAAKDAVDLKKGTEAGVTEASEVYRAMKKEAREVRRARPE